MNKVTVKKWIAIIEKQRDKVAKTRDELDDAISEMEGMKECCAIACDDLQRARDALSELA